MRSKKGFTLVELLVVMAIISILAAIAIPNVQRWILRSRAVQAVSEIKNVETALTKLLADAGRSSINDLIDQDAFNQAMEDNPDTPLAQPNIGMEYWSDVDFDFAVEMYTNTCYALLRKGRGALGSPDTTTFAGESLIQEDVARNLGTSYMSDLAEDPWGNLYQFYPGPWSPRNGLNVFRVYLPKTNGTRLPGDRANVQSGDALSLADGINGITLLDPETGDPVDLIGIPAKDQQDNYIWSWGANLRNGQARYRNPNIGYNPVDVLTNYETAQEPELMGGGDDINNWDKDQTFMRFYN